MKHMVYIEIQMAVEMELGANLVLKRGMNFDLDFSNNDNNIFIIIL